MEADRKRDPVVPLRPYVSKSKKAKLGATGVHAASGVAVSDAAEETSYKHIYTLIDEESEEKERSGFQSRFTKQRVPSTCLFRDTRHSNAVTHIRWSPSYDGLFMTSSMDKSVVVWSIRRQQHYLIRWTFAGAVKDARWSPFAPRVACGGFDSMVTLTDIVTGKVISRHQHPGYVSSILYHPDQSNVFITGTFKSGIYVWDERLAKEVRHTSNVQGQIHDLLFLPDTKIFLSSCEVRRKGSMDKVITAWDFATLAPMSNQICQDVYSCWDMRLHPDNNTFMAQSSGGYIARFAATPPYKLDKFKRYEGHLCTSNRIGFGLSRDGSLVASGSDDGRVRVYNFRTSGTLFNERAHEGCACTDASFSRLGRDYLATCSWNGEVAVWSHDGACSTRGPLL